MAVYRIPSLTATLVQAPVCALVEFDRSVQTHVPYAAVYRGICREPDTSRRHPIYLAELPQASGPDFFLLSADGQTFVRPRVTGSDARTEPRGDLKPRNGLFRVLDALFPGDREEMARGETRNDGYRLVLFDGSAFVLAFERGKPRLWRNVHGNANPFDSDLYFPGRAPADALLVAGFSAFTAQDSHRQLTARSARFLR
jgi:hypothetical protein